MTILTIKDCKDVIGVVLVREGENMTDTFQRWLDAENAQIRREFADAGNTPEPGDLMDGEGLQVDDFEVEDPEPAIDPVKDFEDGVNRGLRGE